MPTSKREGKLLHQFFQKAKKHRASTLKLDALWEENLKWFKGEQELRSSSNDEGDRANTVTNFLFSQMMTMVPILSNRIPEISIIPIKKEHLAHAEVLSDLINRILRTNDFVNKQAEIITNGLLCGRGYMKPVWDRRMRGGLGDIRIEVPDSRSIYKEPGKIWLRDANTIFEERFIDKLSLYQMYPTQQKMIDRIFRKGDSSTPVGPVEETGNTGDITSHATPENVSPTSSEAYVWDMVAKSDKDKDKVSIVECWFIDDTVVDDYLKINKPDGGSKRKKVKKRVFPTGRLMTMSGDFVLDSRPNPFPAFPYIEFNNYFIPGEEYGHGELEQLKQLQEQYNIRMNQIFDGVNFSTFPITIYDHRAGVDPDEIENKPGGWYPVADVEGIKRFDPSGINRAAFDSLPLLERNIETISGVREIQQGGVPGDVRSGFAIEQLQESAQNRLRLKTRNLEAALKQLARNMTRIIGIFYKQGVHYEAEVDLREVDPGYFEYDIKAGINLPQSRMAEQQRFQWMFTNGIVDEQFIIEQSDIPNKEELLARMKPVFDAKRQAMLGQVQGQPAGGPPLAAVK